MSSKILSPGEKPSPSGVVGPDGRPVERANRVIAILARPRDLKSDVRDGKYCKLQFGVDRDFGVVAMDGTRMGPLGVYGGLVSIIAFGVPFDEMEDFAEGIIAAREKVRHEKALQAQGKPAEEVKN